MPFDFFNLSNLAFGNRLTMAFTQLSQLVKEASEHIEILVKDLRAYAQYLNRNYQIADPPEKAGDGCRVNELYDIISERIIVKNMSYTLGELEIDCMIFNPETGRITNVKGYTTLKSGYCYFDYAVSNNSTVKQAIFYADKPTNTNRTELFKFTANTTDKTVKIEWTLSQ